MDDIGYVILDSRFTLPATATCFELFGIMSNVRLKINTTVIVPLWTYDIDAAAGILIGIVPA